MIIEIDERRFVRRRRIIELQGVLPDVRAAIAEASSAEAKAYLMESKAIFETELSRLLEDEKLNP